MKKITITVDVDGNSVSRDYIPEQDFYADIGVEVWGNRIIDMLDTLAKSNEPI